MIEILGIHGEHATRFQRPHKLLERAQWAEQDRVGAPKGNDVVAFAVDRAIFKSFGNKRKPIYLAAVSGEVDVRFDISDLESCLSSRHAKKSRRASYIQKSSTARAANLYDPPHPPAALLDTDSVYRR